MPLTDSQGNMITPFKVGSYQYEYDWYTGSQIGVMIGDVLIDNAVAISFSVEQTKTPIYGYANQYYSFVADGHVLVQGSLTIAFKESGYLTWPIQRFQEKVVKEENPEWNSPRYSYNKEGNLVNSYTPEDFTLTEAAKAAHRRKVMKGNVEQMFDWQSKGGKDPQFAQYNKFVRELEALPDDKFEDWVEVFEDAIWYGSDLANPLVRNKLFSNNILEKEIIENEKVLNHRRLDQYPMIDVWIVYGDMSHQPPNHTVKKLLDLSFVGQAQTIEISGQPIYEQYSFIARNLV